MKTVYLCARVSINGEDIPEKPFKTDVEDGTVIDSTWLYRAAGTVADHYIDQGQICVNGIELLAEPRPSAISLPRV